MIDEERLKEVLHGIREALAMLYNVSVTTAQEATDLIDSVFISEKVEKPSNIILP